MNKIELPASMQIRVKKPVRRHLHRLVGLRPGECQTIADILALDRSLIEIRRWRMSVQHDGAVIFVEQRSGEAPTASIEIPRKTFQKMLAWYETKQPNMALERPAE